MTDHADLIELLRRPTITPSVLTCRKAADALAALVKERDAAFKMSRCECASDDACANLVKHEAALAAALARVKRLEDALRVAADSFLSLGCSVDAEDVEDALKGDKP